MRGYQEVFENCRIGRCRAFFDGILLGSLPLRKGEKGISPLLEIFADVFTVLSSNYM